MSADRAALRQAARAALPEGAFLRRDREDALFVTDALRLDPRAAEALGRAGFGVEARGRLLALTPEPVWLNRLEALYPGPPDFFCQTLLRFAGQPPDEPSLRLFARGARLWDEGRWDDAFDKALRRRIAEALRSGGGGGLYACGLLRHLMKEATP